MRIRRSNTAIGVVALAVVCVGLYLGFAGTIISLVLIAIGVVRTPSAMVAYSSTSFGVIFVAVLKIFHIRPLRRKLILDERSQGVAPFFHLGRNVRPGKRRQVAVLEPLHERLEAIMHPCDFGICETELQRVSLPAHAVPVIDRCALLNLVVFAVAKGKLCENA